MEYGTTIKGMENSTGSNNCFLNVILQSFWHLTSFRKNFQINSYGHTCEEAENCLICEIRVIFN
jgi:Ubiquitin carboxyl-terminal hydrolase